LTLKGLNISEKLEVYKDQETKNKKILIVDDSPMYRKLVSDTFIELGYQVEIGNNGEHGLELFKKGHFDLVITDIEMPLLNGFEFAQKVRAELSDEATPIIALSISFLRKISKRDAIVDFHFT
jgi:CheY-like chemotaxis protein